MVIVLGRLIIFIIYNKLSFYFKWISLAITRKKPVRPIACSQRYTRTNKIFQNDINGISKQAVNFQIYTYKLSNLLNLK